MEIIEIYNHLSFIEDSIRLQYTNFIYRHFKNINSKISFEEIIKRLKNDEPIEYIFNIAEFNGNEFFVDKRVLIPRIETEEIIDKTETFLSKNHREEYTIIDIGTGSGAIILSIAKRFDSKKISFIGIDISPEAIEVAKINRKKLHLTHKVNFEISSFQEFDFSKYENLIIIANLPYIPNFRKLQPSVKNYEPHLALFGGEKGDELIKILKSRTKNLKNLKLLITEEDQGKIQVLNFSH